MPSQWLGGARASGSGSGSTPSTQLGISSPVTSKATVSAWHRKLSRRERHVVRVLSGILRIAVGLDRGHTQQVKRVNASVHEGELRWVVVGAADLGLEPSAARERTAPLSRAIELPIAVVESDAHGELTGSR
jgi:hypothetical protein